MCVYPLIRSRSVGGKDPMLPSRVELGPSLNAFFSLFLFPFFPFPYFHITILSSPDVSSSHFILNTTCYPQFHELGENITEGKDSNNTGR